MGTFPRSYRGDRASRAGVDDLYVDAKAEIWSRFRHSAFGRAVLVLA
jgi:hypothetical protein